MVNLQVILQIAALFAASVGLFISVYRFYAKARAQKKLELLMHDRKSEYISAIDKALHSEKAFQERERLMLNVMLQQLTDSEQDAIMKSFNKKTSDDQRRYLDKLIEESDSEDAYRQFLVNAG